MGWKSFMYIREDTMKKFKNGLSRFIIGLAKKVLLLNSLGMLGDSVFNIQIHELTILSEWLI